MDTEKLCIQPSSAPELSQRPAVIGPYRIDRRIGKGGMAEVFAATLCGSAGFERAVCIKRILPYLGHDPEVQDALAREARLHGGLAHGNIVSVLDCISDGGSPAIVMELVDGMDLKSLVRTLYVRGRTLPKEVAVHIVEEVLRGLEYAHRRRIVHRDISPHNILASRQGEVKITDFGIAKVLVTLATRTDALKGKLYYLSPEQARGEPVDHRTDLYSVGLLLYEMVTGRRFHKTVPGKHAVEAIAETGPPDLDGIEPELAVVLGRLLAPRPEKRLGTAREALLALPRWKTLGSWGADWLGEIVREMLGGRADADDDSPGAIEPTEISPCPTSPYQAAEISARPPTTKRAVPPKQRPPHQRVRPTIEFPTCFSAMTRKNTKRPPRNRRETGRLIGKVVAVVTCILALLMVGLALGIGGAMFFPQ